MKFSPNLKYVVFGLLLLSIGFQSCSEENQAEENGVYEPHQLVKSRDALIAHDWYDLYLQVEKDLEDFRPNPTSRALGYIGIAAYEAVLPGMPDYRSADLILPDYQVSGINPYNYLYWEGVVDDGAFWEVVLNETYYRTFNYFLLGMTDSQIALLDSMYSTQQARLKAELSPSAYDLAVARGESTSLAVIQYAESDTEGAAQVLDVEPEDYNAPSGIGLWRPTGPDFRNACHPYWRSVRLMATPDNGVPLRPHIPYSENVNSNFYQQAKEVNDAVSNLTFEDRWVAEFWSDDIVGITFSPSARQLAIANQLVVQENLDLETALRMYLRLGIALNDASVICWGGKYEYNLERPIDYIRRVINPDFQPILRTRSGEVGSNPNFPAYPSGHSSFAGAGAAVFDHFFPNVTSFTDRCHVGNTFFISDPRTFTSFEEMASENAYSRIPLGVHFRMDCDEGLRIGREVGRYVFFRSLER
jgi:hypothetical protein